MTIRERYAERDDPVIRRLVEQEIFPYAKKEFPDAEYDGILTQLRIEAGTTLVAADENKDECIGFITVKPSFENEDQAGERAVVIDLLAIASGYQGRGIGSDLIQAALQYAMKEGYDEAKVLVEKGNGNGQKFYKKHGFVEKGYYDEIKSFLLAKKLDKIR